MSSSAEYLLSVPLKTSYETEAVKFTEALTTEFKFQKYEKDSFTGNIPEFLIVRNQALILSGANVFAQRLTLHLRYDRTIPLQIMLRKYNN
jgi:hypothetical protein